MKNHVIICDLNALTLNIIAQLKQKDDDCLIIDYTDINSLEYINNQNHIV